MAKRDVNKQRDYIIFLEEVLKTCIRFKEKLESGYEEIYFRKKDALGEWHGTQEEGWGNVLSKCIYDAIISGTKILEVTNRSYDIVKKEDIKINADFDIFPIALPEENTAEDKIKEVLDRLKRGFVDSWIIDRLEKDNTEFFDMRRQLRSKKTVFYLKRTEIKNYLKKYYTLLVDFIIFYDSFDQKQDRDIFIRELLRLDSVVDEKSNEYQINFWSPIILNKLQKANDGVEAFFKQITENKSRRNQLLQEIYKHTILAKVQHSFRWYTLGERQELRHAAIAPFAEKTSKSLKFQIPTYSLKEYDSYEGIGELRLGEKIIHEYGLAKRRGLFDSTNSFSIAILGDLHAEPIKELYRYVKKKIGKQDENLSIIFHIYTKNDVSAIKISDIYCQKSPRDVLLDREKLSRVIDTNNIVFILDCVYLYKSPTVESVNTEFIKQKYAFSAYDVYNTRIAENVDICEQNMLEELYEIVICEQCFNQFGRPSKRANSSLLKFCEQKQKGRGGDSVLYIYVSDMKAFDSIYNDDQYYIRTERYKQKEIGIIRYSSEKVTRLANDNNDKVLVFNIWQFVKVVAIEERNMFISFVDETKDAYMDLDQIYVGIDYTTWPSLLTIHYYSKKGHQYDEVAKRFINEVLLPVLNDRSNNMFSTYIRRAMYSFFYSSAKNVNDMLFIHLFQDKASMLGKVSIAEKNDEDKVKNHLSTEFKYSSKRFYDMIMKNYDISSNMYVGQRKTYHIIQKNEEANERIDKDEIYRNVIKACENLSYDNSYLMKNCKRELNLR